MLQRNDAEIRAARSRATVLVARLKPHWTDVTSKDRTLRREILKTICVEAVENGSTLKAGLPGVLLVAYAQAGDQEAYDLASSLGAVLVTARPKQQGGRPQAGLRDFIIWYLSQTLMLEFPHISWGANSATAEQISAVDIVRGALEAAGMAVIDYKAPHDAQPEPRAIERALRRMQKSGQHRELFDPEWIKFQEAGRKSVKRILSHDP